MGKTLLELFKGSPKDINPRQADKAPYSDDESKEIDGRGLYYKDDLYKYGTNYSKIKSDKETLIEQETTGIRFRSAVDINNPLIYGNEAIRITQRSTPLLEDMKEGANGGKAGGGLIGGAINKARDFVNSTLGIPETQTPSRLLENKNIQISNIDNIARANQAFPGIGNSLPSKVPKSFDDIPSNIPITKDIISKNGKDIGKFLQQSGGGNPKTIGKQALGNGIGFAKDKLRGELFGEGQGVGTAQSSGGLGGKKYSVEYTTSQRTYSDVNFSKTLPSTEGVAKDLEGTKLDLSLVSPIYGVTRPLSNKFGTPAGRFGRTEYAFENKSLDGTRSWINKFAPGRKKTEVTKGTLQDRYGLGKGDKINTLKPSDYDTIDDNGVYKKGENKVGEDLIPFYIGKYGEKKTPFRAIITGLNETVSPSWGTNKMVGNPFPYYTYNQIERSTSFMLKIFCNSPTELATNWEKIESLTRMTYPKINKNNLVNPPIIQFRLGDIYFDKTGFIESLNYTIPDTSTWETRGSIGFLPKYIEVSVTIKFIEDSSVLSALYGYKKSKAAVEKIKEDNNSKGFSESNRTGTVDVGQGQFGEFGTDGNEGFLNTVNKLTINSRGIADTSTSPTGGNIPNKKSNKLNSAIAKGAAKISTPIEADSGTDDLIKYQSSIADKLEGETILDSVKLSETKNNWTNQQAWSFENLRVGVPDGVKTNSVSLKDLPNPAVEALNVKLINPIYVKQDGIVDGTDTRKQSYYEIDVNGNVNFLWDSEEPTIIDDKPNRYNTINIQNIQKSDTLFGLTKPN